MGTTNHKTFHVKPDFLSFTSMAFVIGLCGGVVWAIIGLFLTLIDTKYEYSLWEIALMLPSFLFFYALGFFLTAIVGYPVFKYWRKNKQGIRIQGQYVELNEHNQEISP
jgi:hypothetical protein